MSILTFSIPAIIVLMLSLPLIPVSRRIVTGKKARGAVIFNLCAFFGIAALCVFLPIGGFIGYAADSGMSLTESAASSTGLGYLGAALSTGLSALGAGIAVGSASSAAIGAISEEPKAFGKALIFVALGEGVALYGLLISILIINNL